MQTGGSGSLRDRLTDLSDGALLDLAGAVIAQLAATSLSAAVDDDALRASVAALARCESSVHAEKLRRVAEVDERQAYRAAGERSAADWLGSATGVTPGEARSQAKTAGALRRLPKTAKRLAKGDITPGHAGAAARGLSELSRQAEARRRDAGGDMEEWARGVEDEEETAAAFDDMVAAEAPRSDRSALAKRIDSWTAQRDPDVIRDRERRAMGKRGHWWDEVPDADGLYGYRGKATAAHKAQMDAAMEPLARKTSEDDDRTVAQRRIDALATLCRQACDGGDLPTVGGQRPHVLVITNPAAQDGEDDAEPAWIDGVGPASTATAQLFGCDAETTDIAMDSTGRVWDVGRANGDPTPAQRKAVIVRDRVCVGCRAPASRCQIHHIVYRSRYGTTVVENLVLVCWSCHQGIHHLGWRVQRDGPTFSIDKRAANL